MVFIFFQFLFPNKLKNNYGPTLVFLNFLAQCFEARKIEKYIEIPKVQWFLIRHFFLNFIVIFWRVV